MEHGIIDLTDVSADVEKMKKQYFGKDTKNGLRAIYAVAFTNDEEMSLFTRLIADEYGYEKYSSVPELFVMMIVSILGR